jgi:hypothetical protein
MRPQTIFNSPSILKPLPASTELICRFVEAVANRPERPRWNESSFFKRFARIERGRLNENSSGTSLKR